jgi:hypothetical protein
MPQIQTAESRFQPHVIVLICHCVNFSCRDFIYGKALSSLTRGALSAENDLMSQLEWSGLLIRLANDDHFND